MTSHIEDPQGNSQSGATRRFYGNMKWFSPADQPDDIKQLPPEFLEAKNLWDKDAEGNLDKMIHLLAPYVGARFIASNISGWEELFADTAEGFGETEASEIRIVGIDFSESPIPTCKAEAEFDIPVTGAFAATSSDEWQDENGPFTDAVIFYWNLPRDDETEELDFTCGDNQGVECCVINDQLE